MSFYMRSNRFFFIDFKKSAAKTNESIFDKIVISSVFENCDSEPDHIRNEVSI
jgi:hypothetical protein